VGGHRCLKRKSRDNDHKKRITGVTRYHGHHKVRITGITSITRVAGTIARAQGQKQALQQKKRGANTQGTSRSRSYHASQLRRGFVLVVEEFERVVEGFEGVTREEDNTMEAIKSFSSNSNSFSFTIMWGIYIYGKG
jgi:hypothetical protein